jgi:hypothetical protein|tara:strand:+ start:51 stop:662 length:612 start_codon:yes stop_codon:yes gene_type:complete
MYAIVENNEVKQIITNPKSIVIGDVRYPAKIFQLWSKSELNNIGIYEVITDSTNKKDEAYYINTNEEYNFADNQVTRSWGTATPKRLEDEDAVDQDGENILDDDGNQVINYGLKTEKKRIVKQQASGLLSPTDWYVVKASEVADYSVPSNITTFRADVRAKSNEMETQIDACTNVDELKALYEYTTQEDGTQTRPLAEFPEEI